MLFPRNLIQDLLESARHSPVILINGARQTGKSTLAKGLFPERNRPQYITLDDMATAGLAKTSPKSFLQGLRERVIIDEIQRAHELFLPIKESVDNNRKPGRFILTGSANVLSLPKLAESLAGRMELYTLWPLSQGEIAGRKESFIDHCFRSKDVPSVKEMVLPSLLKILVSGGYPDVLARETARARENWYRSYINSILERDVRELSSIEGLTELPNLLSLIASRAGGLMNLADLSRSLELPYMTLKRYLSLLQAVFLVVLLPSWSSNLGKRLVKTPKLYLNDTGLLCHLMGRDASALQANRTMLGLVLENFIVMELMKQAAWSQVRPRLHHYRTLDTRYEVDLVMEAANGQIVGVESKASSTVTADNCKGLRALKTDARENFRCGIVLYNGSNVLQFDKDMMAMPVSALWSISSGNSPRLYEGRD